MSTFDEIEILIAYRVIAQAFSSLDKMWNFYSL